MRKHKTQGQKYEMLALPNGFNLGQRQKIEDDNVMSNDEFSTVTDLSCPACNAYVEVYLPKELNHE